MQLSTSPRPSDTDESQSMFFPPNPSFDKIVQTCSPQSFSNVTILEPLLSSEKFVKPCPIPENLQSPQFLPRNSRSSTLDSANVSPNVKVVTLPENLQPCSTQTCSKARKSKHPNLLQSQPTNVRSRDPDKLQSVILPPCSSVNAKLRYTPNIER